MLQTKLNQAYKNQLNDFLIRERLITCYQENKHVPLILVSAPIGSGKTVLINQWLENETNAHSWLTIDETMNETSIFIIINKKELVKETPVEETPVEETPAEEAPAEEAPVEETPVEEESKDK